MNRSLTRSRPRPHATRCRSRCRSGPRIPITSSPGPPRARFEPAPSSRSSSPARPTTRSSPSPPTNRLAERSPRRTSPPSPPPSRSSPCSESRFARRTGVAVRACQVGEHAAATAFVAQRVGSGPAPEHIALGRHRYGRPGERHKEAPLVLFGRRRVWQTAIPQRVVTAIATDYVPAPTAVERIREFASGQPVVATAAVDVDGHRRSHRVVAVAGKDEGREARSARRAGDELGLRQGAARPCTERRPGIRDLKLSGRPTRDVQAICLAASALDDEPLTIVGRALHPGAVEVLSAPGGPRLLPRARPWMRQEAPPGGRRHSRPVARPSHTFNAPEARPMRVFAPPQPRAEAAITSASSTTRPSAVRRLVASASQPIVIGPATEPT